MHRTIAAAAFAATLAAPAPASAAVVFDLTILPTIDDTDDLPGLNQGFYVNPNEPRLGAAFDGDELVVPYRPLNTPAVAVLGVSTPGGLDGVERLFIASTRFTTGGRMSAPGLVSVSLLEEVDGAGVPLEGEVCINGESRTAVGGTVVGGFERRGTHDIENCGEASPLFLAGYSLDSADPLSPIPVPASAWGLGAALAGLGLWPRRRRRAAKG